MTIVDIEEQIDLLEVIKGVLPSELKRFSREHITQHKFIKLKDISYYYLDTYYNLPSLKHERDKIITVLIRKVSRFISEFIKEGLIEKYNGKTYKRIENKPSASKLVFIDGSFRNPKFL